MTAPTIAFLQPEFRAAQHYRKKITQPLPACRQLDPIPDPSPFAQQFRFAAVVNLDGPLTSISFYLRSLLRILKKGLRRDL
jgi:hypothetical protein